MISSSSNSVSSTRWQGAFATVGPSSRNDAQGFRRRIRSVSRSSWECCKAPEKQWSAVAAAAAMVSSMAILPQAAWSAEAESASLGASLFQAKCIACHVNGGNIVQRNKTLQLEALKKNGYDDVDEMSSIIAYGQGKMPGYGELCQPKGACTFGARLTENEITALSQYVLDKAQAGW